MTTPASASGTAAKAGEPRDMQARLYREIGISAVAAALRFTRQPDPAKPAQAVQHPLPAGLRNDEMAA